MIMQTLLFILYISPAPNGEELRYNITVTIDGKTIAELNGTICDGCHFAVSLTYTTYIAIHVCFRYRNSEIQTAWFLMSCPCAVA